RQRQQGTCRGGALRRQVRKVDRNELPPDARRRIEGKKVNALGNAVVGDHQVVEHGDVVAQLTRRGIGRDAAQAGDDLALVQARTSLAIASKSPVTNPPSRFSKEALA